MSFASVSNTRTCGIASTRTQSGITRGPLTVGGYSWRSEALRRLQSASIGNSLCCTIRIRREGLGSKTELKADESSCTARLLHLVTHTCQNSDMVQLCPAHIGCEWIVEADPASKRFSQTLAQSKRAVTEGRLVEGFVRAYLIIRSLFSKVVYHGELTP